MPRCIGESERSSFHASSALGCPQSNPMRVGDRADDPAVVRASPGGSSALRTRCTRRSELVTVPSHSHHDALDGQHDVGELGSPRQQDVLHDEEVEAGEQLAACA